MATTMCKRCGGSGFFGPSHVAGGRCFGCNRGEAAPAVAPRGPKTREEIIFECKRALDVCRSHVAQGWTVEEWLEMATDVEGGAWLTALLAIAPADVRTRFDAALDRIRAA